MILSYISQREQCLVNSEGSKSSHKPTMASVLQSLDPQKNTTCIMTIPWLHSTSSKFQILNSKYSGTGTPHLRIAFYIAQEVHGEICSNPAFAQLTGKGYVHVRSCTLSDIRKPSFPGNIKKSTTKDRHRSKMDFILSTDFPAASTR